MKENQVRFAHQNLWKLSLHSHHLALVLKRWLKIIVVGLKIVILLSMRKRDNVLAANGILMIRLYSKNQKWIKISIVNFIS